MNPDRYLRITENVYIDRWRTPPTTPPRRPQRPSFGIIDVLVCLLSLGVVAAILFPVFAKCRDGCNRGRPNCQNNLKQMGLAVLQYTQDNDEQYPLAAVYDADYSTHVPYAQPYGWADALYPYLKSTRLYTCPEAQQGLPHPRVNNKPDDPDPGQIGFTDYWFNRNLFSQPLADVHQPAWTVLMGDGNTGRDATDARYSLGSVPLRWHDGLDSPIHRHREGLNIGYTDGHVKWRNAATAHDPVYNHNSFTLDKATGY